MTRLLRLTAVAAALALGLALGVPGPAAASPWSSASAVRDALSEAQTEVLIGSRPLAVRRLEGARPALAALTAARPGVARRAQAALARMITAVGAGDLVGLVAARAAVWTAVLRVAAEEAERATRAGDLPRARAWLLVREYRPPTRFTRAAADATVALERLAAKALAPGAAAAIVRADLLDTYEAALRAALTTSAGARFPEQASEAAATAAGYWSIVRPAYVSARGSQAARVTDRAFAALAALPGAAAASSVEERLSGFRAAPLSEEELARRAGQLDRFLRLVPIEYGRGVRDGRVVLDFEVQEAITFQGGAAAAFNDLEPALAAIDPRRTAQLRERVALLGTQVAAAADGTRVVAPERIASATEAALELIDVLYPDRWREASGAADFDVIGAALDRLLAAAAAGEWGRAEQARLEAYGVFELGPEQRLRGLAPELFQEIESLFWYGEDDLPGLAVLVKRKQPELLDATRGALSEALGRAEERIGAGPGSRISVVTNSAIIVFREGLEAVLILAALLASLVGAQRAFRRPLLAGALAALAASAVTWVVAQTVLDSLAGWGERLEAVVSLLAIAVLLVILNWFYHRVYWQENLHDLHRRKRRILQGAGWGLLTAPAAGLVALGFSSVYREGFETVLFLQALTLEAGAWTVLQGVALGLAGAFAVFGVVVGLERRLPHKKMLIATGLLITWVLAILVGQTVQTMQKVGWLGVAPVEGLHFPYWAGVWLGLYPTWQGLCAQAGALAVVFGSYAAAEWLRKRRVASRIAAARADAVC